MIKTPTIMKHNPLIMAEFEKAFSEVDHDVVNILLHSLQNELKLDGSNMDLFNYQKMLDRKVLIRSSKFKELGKFGVNANKEIFESLKKISDTSAVIRNFTDEQGRFTKAKTIRIIDSVAWIKEGATLDNRETGFEVQFNEWFLQISTKSFNIQVGNFTNLTLESVSSLKSKYAKKFYEILKAREHRGTSFSLRLDELQAILSLEDKPLSYITKELKRSAPKIEQLISFEYEVFKKDGLISFKYLAK